MVFLFRRLSGVLLLGSMALFFASMDLVAAPKIEWKSITPAELSDQKPHIEADAPAEVIFWNIEVDSRDFPEIRRIKEYIRYKIFAPDKVETITRISQLSSSGGTGFDQSKVELRARLALPNGTIREFGKESIRERTLSKAAPEQSFLDRVFGSDARETKEKFLAVGGVEAGAILEFQIIRDEDRPPSVNSRILQKENIPVRELNYVERSPTGGEYDHRIFILNTNSAQTDLKRDAKANSMVLVAHDIPSLKHEPLSGPPLDYALTLLSGSARTDLAFIARSNISRHLTVDGRKDGPWAGVAGQYSVFEADATEATGRVTGLAEELTKNAGSLMEKAERIHTRVQAMFQKYRKLPKPRLPITVESHVTSLDDVLDFESNVTRLPIRPIDFLFLELCLLRKSGLEARLALLPNRRLVRFNEQLVSAALLSDFCAAVRINGQWAFSCPQLSSPVPFGFVPWYNQGQPALLAQEGKQTFVPVPFTDATQSVVNSIGSFKITSTGDLEGKGGRRYVGQSAFSFRERLAGRTEAQRFSLMQSRFEGELSGAEIKVTKISGLEESEAPLDVMFNLRLPGFATLSKTRLVFRPLLYRIHSSSPFSSETRQFPVQFQYPWRELDQISLQLPPGYEPEAMTPPGPIRGGQTLYHGITLAFDTAKRSLSVKREFASGASFFSAQAYPALKKWYDTVAGNDQQECVFVKSAAASAETTDPSPPPAETSAQESPVTTAIPTPADATGPPEDASPPPETSTESGK